MATTCRILLISGSLRTGSTNTALLRTAQEVAPDGVTTVLYADLDGLPHFGYTGAEIVDAACVPIPVPRGAIGPDGLIAEPTIREATTGALAELAEHVARRRDNGLG